MIAKHRCGPTDRPHQWRSFSPLPEDTCVICRRMYGDVHGRGRKQGRAPHATTRSARRDQ